MCLCVRVSVCACVYVCMCICCICRCTRAHPLLIYYFGTATIAQTLANHDMLSLCINTHVVYVAPHGSGCVSSRLRRTILVAMSQHNTSRRPRSTSATFSAAATHTGQTNAHHYVAISTCACHACVHRQAHASCETFANTQAARPSLNKTCQAKRCAARPRRPPPAGRRRGGRRSRRPRESEPPGGGSGRPTERPPQGLSSRACETRTERGYLWSLFGLLRSPRSLLGKQGRLV